MYELYEGQNYIYCVLQAYYGGKFPNFFQKIVDFFLNQILTKYRTIAQENPQKG